MAENLVDKILKIKGMTCASCEMRIENKLKKLEGIKDVKAVYASSELYVTYDGSTIDVESITKAVEGLDYKVLSILPVTEEKIIKIKSKNEDNLSINQLLGIGIIILAGYLIIKNTVGFNYIPQVNQNMGFGILFVVGLLTSLHCIAMCGGINLSQCVSYKFGNDENARFSKLRPSILYNGGRVISYTIIGGIVGTMGSVVSFSGTAKGIVAILSGAFMVIMGLNMLNIFPWLRKLNPRMPKLFGNKIYSNNGKHGPFYIGLLNGLMPCGPLQAMQIYALGTGSFVMGAASMFFFSVGTVPLMFGFGVLSSILSKKINHRVMRVSAILVIMLGIMMTSRGFDLSGINIAFANPGAGSVAKIEDGVQYVTTKIQSGRYVPIIVQKDIPVKWIIKAEESELNGCNNPITIPKYNIVKELVPGENIIEFTPSQEGSIIYTCWMGMISSNIKVVDNINDLNIDEIQQQLDNYVPFRAGNSGCCGL